MSENTLKRQCDFGKYQTMPCVNQTRYLDEYFDTQLASPNDGYAYLCRECTLFFGQIADRSTTHYIWSKDFGCYMNADFYHDGKVEHDEDAHISIMKVGG